MHHAVSARHRPDTRQTFQTSKPPSHKPIRFCSHQNGVRFFFFLAVLRKLIRVWLIICDECSLIKSLDHKTWCIKSSACLILPCYAVNAYERLCVLFTALSCYDVSQCFRTFVMQPQHKVSCFTVFCRYVGDGFSSS